MGGQRAEVAEQAVDRSRVTGAVLGLELGRAGVGDRHSGFTRRRLDAVEDRPVVVGGQKSICTAWLDRCPPTPSGVDQEQSVDDRGHRGSAGRDATDGENLTAHAGDDRQFADRLDAGRRRLRGHLRRHRGGSDASAWDRKSGHLAGRRDPGRSGPQAGPQPRDRNHGTATPGPQVAVYQT